MDRPLVAIAAGLYGEEANVSITSARRLSDEDAVPGPAMFGESIRRREIMQDESGERDGGMGGKVG